LVKDELPMDSQPSVDQQRPPVFDKQIAANRGISARLRREPGDRAVDNDAAAKAVQPARYERQGVNRPGWRARPSSRDRRGQVDVSAHLTKYKSAA
jgi:hypothetical protein